MNTSDLIGQSLRIDPRCGAILNAMRNFLHDLTDNLAIECPPIAEAQFRLQRLKRLLKRAHVGARSERLGSRQAIELADDFRQRWLARTRLGAVKADGIELVADVAHQRHQGFGVRACEFRAKLHQQCLHTACVELRLRPGLY